MKNVFKTARRGLDKARARGVTLLEMLVVIGVISVLITIATYGYSTYIAAKGAQEARIIDTAAQCVRTLYANNATFNGITAAVAANNNCFPRPNVTSIGSATATVTNNYGGSITVEPAKSGTTDDVNFQIKTNALPPDVCRALATSLVGASVIAVDGDTNGDPVQVKADTAAAADKVGVGTNCGTSGTAARVWVTYTR
jgi:prepilin-type N-terminal cleavage/methylation domain-containing protein